MMKIVNIFFPKLNSSWQSLNIISMAQCKKDVTPLLMHWSCVSLQGSLARCVKVRVARAPGMSGKFSRHRGLAIPTCITARAWRTCRDAWGCMPGSLTSGFPWSRWRGKLSRHSRRMRNPRFYVSGKRPITALISHLYSPLTRHALVFVETALFTGRLGEPWNTFIRLSIPVIPGIIIHVSDLTGGWNIKRSWRGNSCRISDPLWGESTAPCNIGSDKKLRRFSLV